MSKRSLVRLAAAVRAWNEPARAELCKGGLQRVGARAFSTPGGAAAPVFAPGDGPLFRKLLIANRGEIAIRVMRTARKLGIPTVAVYSDADASAVHTRFADECVRIGPPPSTASYLNSDAILEAMRQTGADAVHPGYGFLSENEAFATAVEGMGAAFIGPPAHAVRAMGDKVESKRFAAAAGVHTIPGWVGVVENAEHAITVAKEIGFPVMVKASAGGGGKGMRIAWDEKDLAEGYVLATQEAASAFGDSRMLIEKFIEQPRHVEIQVLGDRHGTVVWLPERECSIQRRNQKVIEEAPSPVGTPELRRAMGEQAVALCKAVGYYSAGTCEFLVDVNRNFYFLEMNTRLQVEHPITEAITGLDLVEQMLRVGAGHPLGLTQEQVQQPKGWAVECRVYAEDSSRGFLPSIGRLQRYREPCGEGIRVDSGVEEGSEISVHYDPMISKLVAAGPTREVALARAAQALDGYVIRGVQHNAPLLRSVLDFPDFMAGDISTAFLAQHFATPQASAPAQLPLTPAREQEVVALAAALRVWRDLRLAANPTAQPRTLVLTGAEGEQAAVQVRPAPPGMVPASSAAPADPRTVPAPALEVELPDRVLILTPGPNPTSGTLLVEVQIDGRAALCQIISRDARRMTLQYCGAHRTFAVDTEAVAALQRHMPPPFLEDLSKVVKSPMPGTLVAVVVSAGDLVQAGDEVAVVEAMKMRNVLRATAPGKVATVEVAAGASVAADQVILRLE